MPNAQLIQEFGSEIMYVLPTNASSSTNSLMELLKQLDNNRDALRIHKYGISDTTLEEVSCNAERSSLYMDRLRTIVTEVYKAINDMSPELLQDLFVIKANIHDVRVNNKMKLYKFKTMIYGKHSIKYVAGILWNSINVDIKNTDNVNVFKRKILGTGKVPFANVVSD